MAYKPCPDCGGKGCSQCRNIGRIYFIPEPRFVLIELATDEKTIVFMWAGNKITKEDKDGFETLARDFGMNDYKITYDHFFDINQPMNDIRYLHARLN